ncbi:kinase-like protein [Exidia glandulosa HHB12029]|uniref:non-specific serine/threonine protein kinase n=2 Tax=Exidia glandulosa HHB12029 TaxID=1314781 RepID=A0A165H2N1_EXIGL|nr:kinase-like protein [Exidia glandulosa HHB12029]
MPPGAPAATASAPADDDLAPYVVANEIGKGSFATVYRGYHSETREQVAVKTVSRKLLSAKLLENLQTEIKILKRLNHKHITRLVQIIERPRNIYLVMEYCAGGDLSNYIKRRGRVEGLEYIPAPGQAPIYYPHPRIGGLDEVVVRSFLRQLARALKFLRQADLIHRDLKPQNLLLTPQSESDKAKGSHPVGVPILKVADFGFARSLPNAMMAETLCGSPLYMAPEILRYEKYDAKADLWSVGAVLYEMSVGKPPFRAQNHMELLRRIEHARSNVKFPDEDPSSPQVDPVTGNPIKPVPADIKELIRSLLKRHPVERATYEQFFASKAIANSKTRLSTRRSSSKVDSTATSVSDIAPPPSTSRSPTTTTLPTVKEGQLGTATAKDVQARPEARVSNIPTPMPTPPLPLPSPSRVPDIPPSHRVIPKEVLDPKAIFPPSPFDFRGRTHKAHTDLGADVSADRAETPPSSPPTRSPLSAPTGSSPRAIGNITTSPLRASPRTKPSAFLPAQDVVEGTNLANMTTSMGETTRDYVFIDTNAVEFNRKVDEINTRQNQPLLRQGSSRAQPVAYPPGSPSERRASAPNSPASRNIELAPPPTFPPPGQYGYAQGLAYTPTRMASNALAKALNIASKKLFGTSAGGQPSGGSPSSVESDTSGGLRRSPSSHARATSAPSSPIEGRSMPESLTRKPTAADEAENALFANLEDLAQKTHVLGKWADSLFDALYLARNPNVDPSRSPLLRRRTSYGEDKSATAIAVYMLLMQFSQRALDQLKEYHEQLPQGQLAGSGFDAALKWFKNSFIKSHERAALIQQWLPHEQAVTMQWIEQLTYTHALELSREAARKELLDKAETPDECEKLYEESLWCLYALRDDMLEGGKPFMEQDRKTITDWITRTKLRLVRCRNRMGMDQNARLTDARADANLDEAFRQPAPWDVSAQ